MKCKVLQVIVLSSDLASLRQGHSSPSWNYLFVPVSGLMPPSRGTEYLAPALIVPGESQRLFIMSSPASSFLT